MPPIKTIAVVDDDQIYVNAFKKLLITWKFNNPVLFFVNGKEALNFMQLNEASALPDILLLDVNMPVMNGWQFLENFEKISDNLTKKTKIYLVSSSIWEEDFKRAGKIKLVKEFIIKPILKEKLQKILD